MEQSPEARPRIYKEEEARLDAEQQLKQKENARIEVREKLEEEAQTEQSPKGYSGCIGPLVICLITILTLVSSLPHQAGPGDTGVGDNSTWARSAASAAARMDRALSFNHGLSPNPDLSPIGSRRLYSGAEDDRIGASATSESFVKVHLRLPETAHFPAMTDSRVQVVRLDKHHWLVSSYVDAQVHFHQGGEDASAQSRYTCKLWHCGDDQWLLGNLWVDRPSLLVTNMWPDPEP